MHQTKTHYANAIKLLAKKNSLAILFAVFVMACILIFSYLNHAKNRAITASAIESSSRYAEVISQFRSLYTSQIVAKAQRLGIDFSHDFSDKPNSLPLPATMTFLLSEKMRENGLTIKTYLYSKYPFPWREDSGGLRGDFEKSAWNALLEHPQQPYSRIAEVDGVPSIRYAIADTLKAECVDCHNNHPQSPKTGWKKGDLRGVLEVIAPLNVDSNNVDNIFFQMQLLFSMLTLAAFCALFYIFASLQKKNQRLDSLNSELNTSLELHKKHEAQLLTANKHTQMEKSQADLSREEAVNANKAKSIFLANISHEIRTPMNAILGYTQILQASSDIDADNKRSLDIISKSGNHLLNIINGILDLSKLESGTTKLIIGNFDLIETCTSAVDMFCLKALQKEISLAFSNDIPLDQLVVNGDQLKLRQVLINLLSNAIKFTASGNVLLSLNMLEDSVFHFQVTDSGIGIKDEDQSSIFDAFNQANGACEYGGTGLGLSITKKYLKMMLSDIHVESEWRNGACFYFDICLPIQQKAIPFSGNIPEIKTLDDGSNSILIVDDILLNRWALERVLVDHGYQVFCVKNSASALNLLKLEPVDLVLSDIMMPAKDGLELVRQIKQHHPLLPVIAISASTVKYQDPYYKDLGFDDFIAKPFNFSAILQLIEAHLAPEKDMPQAQYQENTPECNDNTEFALPIEFRELIIEQCDLYLVKEVEIIIDKLMAKYPDNDSYFSQLQRFVNDYDLEGLTSFLKDDTNAR